MEALTARAPWYTEPRGALWPTYCALPLACQQEVESAVFDSDDSLSSYVNYCSVNKASINRNNSKVVAVSWIAGLAGPGKQPSYAPHRMNARG